MSRNWYYERLDPETYDLKHCPVNDLDGHVTGHIVIDVPSWFDENPEERIRLGWIKHIMGDRSKVEYNSQTQYLVRSVQPIDDYTVEDVFFVLDKTEDMLLLEEMLEGVNGAAILPTSGIWIGGMDYE